MPDLDRFDKRLRQASLVEGAEDQRVMVDEIGHDRGRQGEERAAKMFRLLQNAPQALEESLLVLFLPHTGRYLHGSVHLQTCRSTA